MTDFPPQPLQPESMPDELFYSSRKSPVGKQLFWLRVTAPLFLLLSLFGTGGRGGVSLLVLSFGVGILLILDWIFRKQLKLGPPVVILRPAGIESLLFQGKEKHCRWDEIEAVSLKMLQGMQFLELRLAVAPGKKDRVSFWRGHNPVRPTLHLGVLDRDTQVRLLDAIHRRLPPSASGAGVAGATNPNPLVEEQAFEKSLEALAPIPWVTWSLVAANVLIWCLGLGFGASLVDTPVDKLLAWGGNAASEVQRGEWWRLLTATFLHASLMHVAMNMLGLLSAGITLERIYGHRLFLLIYLGSGLLGSTASLYFSARSGISVGASGAVFGITGALLVALLQHRQRLPKAFSKQTLSSTAIFIVYALLQGFSKTGIDNAAHVGGLIGGALLAWGLPERLDMPHFLRTWHSRAQMAVAATLLACITLLGLAPPATVDFQRVVTGNAAMAKGMTAFVAAMRALEQEQREVEAGRMTLREADERSRTEHAPVFRQVQALLAEAYVPPTDPRAPMLQDTRRMVELMLEMLAMESVEREGSDKPEPIDPERAEVLAREFAQLSKRIQQTLTALERKQRK